MAVEELEKMLREAEEVYLRGDLNTAEELCKKVISASAQNTSPYADATRQLARLEIFRGNYSKALELSFSALAMANSINDNVIAAKVYSTIATVYFQLSDYEKAIDYYNKAIQLFEQLDLRYLVAVNYNNIANVYFKQAYYELALLNYTKALDIAEATGNKHVASMALGNLGILHKDLGDVDLALNYGFKSLEVAKEIENKMGIMNGYSNIALVYMLRQEYNLALEYFNLTISLAAALQNRQALAVTTGNAGLAYFYKKDYTNAYSNYNTALAITEELGNRQGSAMLYQNLGLLYSTPDFGMADMVKGENYLLKAVAANKELGTKYGLMESHSSLIQLYKQQQRWKDCVEQMELHFNLYTELKSEETQKKIAAFHFQRDLEVKEAEHKVTEKILHKILPKSIADKIKDGEEKIIQRFESASVLFADMVGFTVWSRERDVNEVAETLNHIFNLFDELALEFGVEKIKTIGDAYLCVAGLPEPCKEHAERMARMALAMHAKIQSTYPSGEIKLRIGIHCGEVIAGVLGKNKYAYDLWGDTVNTASRMESHGEPGKVQVSNEFRNLLADKFRFEERGEIEVKGKGRMKTWFLLSC